jgi:hypothetical protein
VLAATWQKWGAFEAKVMCGKQDRKPTIRFNPSNAQPKSADRKHLNWHREGATACSASAMTGEDI